MATKSKPKPKSPKNGGTLRVRMYRVGFGDFFLLTVPSNDGPQHVLIDCGVTPGTTHAGDIGTIKDAVAHMAVETGNHLALVIVTHRHMDHIIGFSRCADVFKNFTVDAIWMPYWESEYDKNAAKFQAELTSIALQLQQRIALSAGAIGEAGEMLAMLRNATGVDDQELLAVAGGKSSSKKGTGGGTNAASLAMLKQGFGVKPEYYAKGDQAKLPPKLAAAGLTAEILGPPPADTLTTFMKLTDLKKGVGQYLDDTTDVDDDDRGKLEPFGKPWRTSALEYPPNAFRELVPRGSDVKAKAQRGNAQLEKAVSCAQPDMLFAAVKTLDSFLNNQSLVVLFTLGGTHLLFAGDAQAGNWEYWMYGGTPTKAPSLDDITKEGASILGNLGFYKVGHHGSTNATPVTAVAAMGKDFASMCSTQEGSYGNPDKGTEVPREPLLNALMKKSALVRSDHVAIKGVPAVDNAPKKLPKPAKGRYEVGDLYVDYLL